MRLVMKSSQFPKQDTVFSLQEHIASARKAARVMKAKIVGYHLSKWMIVSVACSGLVVAGTLQSLAWYTPHKSPNRPSHVRVSNGNNNHFGGNSHSRASVNNSVHISTGNNGGGHGGSFFINRGNGGKNHNNHNNHNNNNHNNGNKNRTVKRIVRVKKDINKTSVTINKNIDIQKKYNPCSYDWNCNNGNNYNDNNDNDNTNHNSNYNYNDNSCGCQYYTQPTQPLTPIKIINNNSNTNNNSNEQSVDVQQPSPDMYYYN